MYEAKILEDSITYWGERLTTFEFTFPRIVLAELNTHRELSRNSASSRAIPVERRIAAIMAGLGYIPDSFGKNRPGMQATEVLDDEETVAAIAAWTAARNDAVTHAATLAGLGVHKQTANRVIEPYCLQTAIVSGTNWENFWGLRVHKDAQPEFRRFAALGLDLYRSNRPHELAPGEWHLPLVPIDERAELRARGFDLRKVSVGRCCRVSLLTHDGKRDPQADVDLCDRITAAHHMSPLEHAARAMLEKERPLFRHIVWEWDPVKEEFYDTGRVTHRCGNFDGWVQHRKMIPGEALFRG